MGSGKFLVAAGAIVAMIAGSGATVAFAATSADTDDHLVFPDEGIGGVVDDNPQFIGLLNGGQTVVTCSSMVQIAKSAPTGLNVTMQEPTINGPCGSGTSTPVGVSAAPSGWSARYVDVQNDETSPDGPGTVGDKFKLVMPKNAFTISFQNGCVVTFGPTAPFIIGGNYIENSSTINYGKRPVTVAVSGSGCTVASPWDLAFHKTYLYPMEDQG
jgi:hypothetical protein